MAPAPATSVDSLNPQIVEFLKELGSCWRCAVRFTRERKSEAYQQKIVVIILFYLIKIILSNIAELVVMDVWTCEVVKEEPEEKILKISPCVLCLGLVQDHFIQDKLIDDVSR